MSRLLPVPDEQSTAYWEGAARHELVLDHCRNCGRISHPPDVTCARCHHPGAGFESRRVAGRAILRSWIVVRQSFLPGFEADLPLRLVDVALEEDPEIRLVGRLLDGPDVALAVGDAVVVAFEDLEPGIAVPAFRREPSS